MSPPLTVTRGRVHEYLGITLDFSMNGKVTINMQEHIKGLLEEAPSDTNGEASTPAVNHLFVITETFNLLNNAQSELFHSMSAKLHLLTK